jgi:hypothetical protein
MLDCAMNLHKKGRKKRTKTKAKYIITGPNNKPDIPDVGTKISSK